MYNYKAEKSETILHDKAILTTDKKSFLTQFSRILWAAYGAMFECKVVNSLNALDSIEQRHGKQSTLTAKIHNGEK